MPAPPRPKLSRQPPGSNPAAPPSVWIVGAARSGKTTALVETVRGWLEPWAGRGLRGRGLLALAADGETRGDLQAALAAVTGGRLSLDCTTPLGFIQREVTLFYPLLAERLNWRAQFPIFLKPENEQELALRLWGLEDVPGGDSLARRLLDLGQLAAYGGVDWREIPDRLSAGLGEAAAVALAGPGLSAWLEKSGEALATWQDWCAARGLVTYAIATDWYGRYLLPEPSYRDRLLDRYRFVVADDTDDFPALVADVLETLLAGGVSGALSFCRDGGARRGLGADPGAIEQVAGRCGRVRDLAAAANPLRDALLPLAQLAIDDPFALIDAWPAPGAGIVPPTGTESAGQPLPDRDGVERIWTVSRGQMLREAAEWVWRTVRDGEAQAEEIALIGPGIDAIAGYVLERILQERGVAVSRLADQRPLIALASTRALLALMALVYPGLGRTLEPEAIAEMLVVLSGRGSEGGETPEIDPVRAGAIADHCFVPDLENPHLLPVTAFPRWDRLGYQATSAYDRLRAWIEEQKSQWQQRAIATPLILLDRAIQQFLWQGGRIAADELADLRELLEALDRYWQIAQRLDPQAREPETLARFVRLLRRGAMTANPYPSRALGRATPAVTLANLFQYRTSRRAHRVQVWLDVASPLWSQGGAAVLFGSPFFLRDWDGQARSLEAEAVDDRDRLRRIVADLLGRTGQRLVLCASDLSASGQDQEGPLRSLLTPG